ncbi:unnamed protein product, partial [Arabidopsis halleri]
MARDLSLGPSDAPCPMETSTVHGDFFFRATALPPRKALSSCLFASAADHGHCPVSPNNQSPEMLSSSQISLSFPVSRRICFLPCNAVARLGFRLVGLVPNFGPTPIMKPKPTSIKPRSATLFI